MKAKKNYMYESNNTDKDGRIIKNAHKKQVGIAKMRKMKRAKKRAEKISMIVEANGISKMLGDM